MDQNAGKSALAETVIHIHRNSDGDPGAGGLSLFILQIVYDITDLLFIEFIDDQDGDRQGDEPRRYPEVPERKPP